MWSLTHITFFSINWSSNFVKFYQSWWLDYWGWPWLQFWADSAWLAGAIMVQICWPFWHNHAILSTRYFIFYFAPWVLAQGSKSLFQGYQPHWFVNSTSFCCFSCFSVFSGCSNFGRMCSMLGRFMVHLTFQYHDILVVLYYIQNFCLPNC